MLASCLTGLDKSVLQKKLSVVIQLIPNRQTGGQRYSDTSPFSIPRIQSGTTYNAALERNRKKVL
jgi:hypothetical protein